MNNMISSKFVVLLVLGVCRLKATTAVLSQGGNIQWVSRDQIMVMSELVHGGSEDGFPQYVARSHLTSTSREWIPGKAISQHNGNFVVYSPYGRKEYKSMYTYQFLVASPGATRWTTADHMPSNAIIGGNDPRTFNITRICHAVYDGRQMIGKTFTNSKSCILPYRGGEYESWDSAQVLVSNLNTEELDHTLTNEVSK